MKQIVQSARTGSLELVEVPAPAPGRGQVLVRSCYSVMSPGTDRLGLAFARKSLLGKARSRPDLVRQVARKLRQEGPLPTLRTVVDRLDAPQPLGYSSAGVVEALGEGCQGFAPGDRVACAGAGYASHAELVVVPENLVARVPDGVRLQDAAFSTLGAIALQGVRVAEPTLGEVAAVVGLGLIGQLVVQLLRANGCRVLALDLAPERVKSALDQGARWALSPADDLDVWSAQATDGHGADLVVVAASADSSAPLDLAARISRHKGRISMVGALPMELDRRVFYEKELELRMSTSYGPGRYDRSYEEEGLDYPLPYVRWTENRNLQAFLALIAEGSVTPERLAVELLPFEEAVSAYEDLASGKKQALAGVFRYAEDPIRERSLAVEARAPRAASDAVGVAFLGAGSYAKAVLLPALKSAGAVRPIDLVTATGPSARRSAERFGFERCGTDPGSALADPDVDLVFVATRHDSHAELAARALRAGKAVWLEKPVGLGPAELEEVLAAARESSGFLAIGYNRRFSSHARALREAFAGRAGAPLAIRYRVAAGAPPGGSWILDPEVGGGRLVGEVCHFVDLCLFLVGQLPAGVYARRLGRSPEADDSLVTVLDFPDGSTATIEYLARAGPELPKEQIEISGAGKTALCENFRLTRIGPRAAVRGVNQDKGQARALAEVMAAVRGGQPSPFRLDEIAAVSRATFAMDASARSAERVALS